jgi:sulfatase maturation enzyme AslB (radical SAM superfamily)
MKESLITQELLRKELGAFFRDVVFMALHKPSLFARALRIYFAQTRAARRRVRLAKRGIPVPPIMIMSVTERCNLHCTGCYAHEFHGADRDEMDDPTIESIVKQASDLGISVVLLAGGEPFLRKDELLRLAANNPSLLFLIFTNGLMITDQIAGMLTRRRNIVPVVSLEGDSAQTDTRRGKRCLRPPNEGRGYASARQRILWHVNYRYRRQRRFDHERFIYRPDAR